MTLGETISFCRRRAQLSQEALAELTGVSRQAVSKWELDEAIPEAARLTALAGAFHISVDQLLSGRMPEEDTVSAAPPQSPDHLSRLGRFIRRYGWLAGVYIALSGAGVAIVGGIARYAFRQMFAIAMADWLNNFGEFDAFSGQAAGLAQMGQVFVSIAAFLMVLGILTIIAGMVLAVILRKRGNKP